MLFALLYPVVALGHECGELDVEQAARLINQSRRGLELALLHGENSTVEVAVVALELTFGDLFQGARGKGTERKARDSREERERERETSSRRQRSSKRDDWKFREAIGRACMCVQGGGSICHVFG